MAATDKDNEDQIIEVAVKFAKEAIAHIETGRVPSHVAARKLVAAAAIINKTEMHVDEKIHHELLELKVRNGELHGAAIAFLYSYNQAADGKETLNVADLAEVIERLTALLGS